MAATLRQRQRAAEVLRAGGTKEEARRAAGVKSVSTIKRWEQQPEFRAMISSSPDLRPGTPPAIGNGKKTAGADQNVRCRMWVSSGREGSPEVLGHLIPPAAFEIAGSVLQVHVVQADAIEGVKTAIAAGSYPAESPYVPVPLARLDDALENLPLLCLLGSDDPRESLMAWLELWRFIDEHGRTRTLAESLWEGQQRFLESLLRAGHIVSIKSRKVGLSTLVCAHAAWAARIRDINASVHLISYREDAAQELLRSLRRGFDGLPPFLRLPLTRDTSTVLSYTAGPSDTRTVKVFPATPNAAIEATCSHLVLDEWAHTFDPEAVWGAVEPTLAPRATSALITTARGPGDFVHNYYRRSEAGETRHRAVFVSAVERPDRSPAWRDEKLGQEGKVKTLRNYPLTAEEAFAYASEPYFSSELLEVATQQEALPPSPARRGDRYVKAWDLGRKDASVCVVLRAPGRNEEQVLHVVGYQRLVGQEWPAIQRAIEEMHSDYPGPTVIEGNNGGSAVIQNLRLPKEQVIEYTTTKASKPAMLTALEIQLQKRTLKIHSEFEQLHRELADYRLEDNSITQDSVIALGLAVVNADHAHANAGGGINARLFRELNFGYADPPSWWLDTPKNTTDGPAIGLIPSHRAPDLEHGAIRLPYHAEIDEIPKLLEQGWTPDDATLLEQYGYRIENGKLTPIKRVASEGERLPAK